MAENRTAASTLAPSAARLSRAAEASPPQGSSPSAFEIHESTLWHDVPYPIVLVVLATAYFLAGKLGLTLAFVHKSATTVWAPTGITLAAMLLLGPRVWPGIFVGAFLVNATTAGSMLTSLGIATGNTLEGIVGAALVRRFANGSDALDRVRDAFRFIVLGGIVSTTVSPTIGVVSLCLAGYARWVGFGPIWSTWWLGDMGGALLVAPLILLWYKHPRLNWSRAQVLEAATLLASLLVVGYAVFGGMFPLRGGSSLAFVCMPLLIWAAFRFAQPISATAMLVLSAIAVWGAMRSIPASQRWERNETLIVLQIFLGVAAMTTLVLSAVIAERRRAQEVVRVSSEELRAALAELEAFSHSISHDLRSPIGAVMNYAAIIEEDFRDRLDDEAIRLLRRIRASAESAARLLDQLMQFAWVERDEGEKQSVDMTSLAREAYAEVAAGAEGVGTVEFHLPDLPTSRGSAVLLTRVFRNLFSNAVKYTRDRDYRRIEVVGQTGERENTYCVIDNGIGFEPALGEAVFQPFRRLSGAKKFEGSGLGLAIAAKIIRRHNGRIWAESDGSNGARFYFTLPNGEARS